MPATAPHDAWLPEASPTRTAHLVAAGTREIVAGSGLYRAVCGQTCELPPDESALVMPVLEAVIAALACPRCDRTWHGRMRMWTS